jgi:hypothetical protein
MYNAQLKKRFIKEFSDSEHVRESASYLFRSLEKFEEAEGKDLSAMDTDALQRAVDHVSGFRARSVYLPVSILKNYATWCMENGVDGATDNVFRLRMPGIEKLRHSMLKNPKQLQRYLDDFLDPEDMQTADNNLRAWYWLGYSGLTAEDALTVKSDELDFSSMILKHNGNMYPIYRESVPALRNCVELSQYRYVHPNYGEDKVIFRDRWQGDELIRGLRGVQSIDYLRVEFSKRNKKALSEGKTDLNLSYKRVWMSGVFYRMYEDELAGFPVSFDEVTARRVGDKEFKLDSGRNTQQAKLDEISRQYRVDYERWKQTLQ